MNSSYAFTFSAGGISAMPLVETAGMESLVLLP